MTYQTSKKQVEAEYKRLEAGRAAVRTLLELAGDDPSREGLLETPDRVVKAWSEWFGGGQVDIAGLFKTFEDGAQNVDEMVLLTNIPLYSFCEHHLAPIMGHAHVAYLPRERIVGLSKIARVVDAFARRPQVQERLTTQIAEAIQEHLEPVGCGVVITARHMCMESRGVKTHGVNTTTSKLMGNFRLPEVRSEFFELIKIAGK
jgi:GTP cyclohydrolase I